MGIYATIKLKNPNKANELNTLLKQKYHLNYMIYNNVEFGIFYSKEMFYADLEYINDTAGNLFFPLNQKPVSPEAFLAFLSGPSNCGNRKEIGAYCVNLSNLNKKDIIKIKTLIKFSRTKDFDKYISVVESINFEALVKFNRMFL